MTKTPTPWTVVALTIFPEMLPGPLDHSLAGKALKNRVWRLETLDIRDFARDKHRSVDDAPFGGGPGMVMRPDVVDRALLEARRVFEESGPTGAEAPTPIYLSPRGRRLDQAMVKRLARGPGAVLLCGRFEGVDQRVLDRHQVDEISLGDFVLSGGEPAAIALVDACVRLLPGVMGAEAGVTEESFEGGLLEYPHYTRPAKWSGVAVPEALLSGHHGRIEKWRRSEAEKITRERRPDLYEAYRLAADGAGDDG